MIKPIQKAIIDKLINEKKIYSNQQDALNNSNAVNANKEYFDLDLYTDEKGRIIERQEDGREVYMGWVNLDELNNATNSSTSTSDSATQSSTFKPYPNDGRIHSEQEAQELLNQLNKVKNLKKSFAQRVPKLGDSISNGQNSISYDEAKSNISKYIKDLNSATSICTIQSKDMQYSPKEVSDALEISLSNYMDNYIKENNIDTSNGISIETINEISEKWITENPIVEYSAIELNGFDKINTSQLKAEINNMFDDAAKTGNSDGGTTTSNTSTSNSATQSSTFKPYPNDGRVHSAEQAQEMLSQSNTGNSNSSNNTTSQGSIPSNNQGINGAPSSVQTIDNKAWEENYALKYDTVNGYLIKVDRNTGKEIAYLHGSYGKPIKNLNEKKDLTDSDKTDVGKGISIGRLNSALSSEKDELSAKKVDRILADEAYTLANNLYDDWDNNPYGVNDLRNEIYDSMSRGVDSYFAANDPREEGGNINKTKLLQAYETWILNNNNYNDNFEKLYNTYYN